MIEVKANRDSDDWEDIHTKIQAKCTDPEDLINECYAVIDTMYSMLYKHDSKLAEDFFCGCLIGLPFIEHCADKPEEFKFMFEDDNCDGDCEHCENHSDIEEDDEDCDSSEPFGKYEGDQSKIFRGLFLVGSDEEDNDISI